MAKVLLINGSGNEHGCTFTALSEVAKALNEEGVETEIIQLGKDAIRDCIGCGSCGKLGRCVFDDDQVNLVAAAGRAKMLNGDYVGQDAVVIDVGINVDENGKLCGDVDYDTIQDKAQAATPVPGGVGAVTTAVLAKHLVRAAGL